MNLKCYIKEIRRKGNRYFTVEQLMLDLNISRNAALNSIARIKKDGDLISPAKGLYVIVPPEHQPYGSIPAEDLTPILMSYLKLEYYVAMLSAASFYGATHQKPAHFQIITNKRIKHPLEFGQIKLEITHKKNINNLPIRDFTVSTGYLKVASPELVIFDLLSYMSKSGGLNHIATVLSELVSVIDCNKLLELAEQIGEKAWLQRLGFILEKIDSMDEEKVLQLINQLQNYLSKKSLVFVPLATELAQTGCARIKKWKIIENTTIESDL